MYTSAIVIDFGSSNSGAARIDTYKDGRLVYSTPQFCHSDGYYAKDATWFFIHPKLLERAEVITSHYMTMILEYSREYL